MGDPAGLKLPLEVSYTLENTYRIIILNRDGNPIEITEHRAEIIVAALTADAEKETG